MPLSLRSLRDPLKNRAYALFFRPSLVVFVVRLKKVILSFIYTMKKFIVIKELCKFFAGFQLAHVVAHILLQVEGGFPFINNFVFFEITLTKELNGSAIWTNAIIFFILFYFAYLWKRKNSQP